MSVRVVVVDDQPLMRQALRTLLEATGDIVVAGEAGDGHAAVRVCELQRPDVVLMDVRMPGRDGLDATREVVERGLGRVLVLTTFDLDEYVDEALRFGASGFLVKNAEPEEIVRGVLAVANGDAVLSPQVTQRVIDRLASAPVRADAERVLASLTDREREVLDLIAIGRSNAEIAADLFVSEATAKTHVSRVLAKLGVRDRVHAVIWVHNSGLNRRA